jgi:hypothetical protein
VGERRVYEPDEPAGASHVDWSYRPREYSTGSDLGAVTGGQAVAYSQPETACTQILTTLDRLKSTRAASVVPHEQIAACARHILAELRAPSGPRLGDVEGQPGQLRDILTRAGETVKVRTAFVTLNDYYANLAQAWSERTGRRPLS